MPFDTIFPLALLVLVVGGYTIYSIYSYRLARASTEWPMTEGLVLDASLDEDRGGDNIRFNANVKYRYSVGGKNFMSTRLCIGPTSYSYYSWASDALRGVRKGQPVDVYYDPKQPGRAVIVTGHHVEHIHAFIGCVAGWLIVGFMVLKIVLGAE